MKFEFLFRKLGVLAFVLGAILVSSTLHSVSQVNVDTDRDFGDAPAILFPTTRNIFVDDFGVAHLPDQRIWLGDAVTYESKAMPIDNDLEDDAEYKFGVDVNGAPFFEVVVSASNNALDFAYLNVLVDLEGTCDRPDEMGWNQPSNHVVNDQRITVQPGQQFTVRVPAELFVDTRDHWIRITLSNFEVKVFNGGQDHWNGKLNAPFTTGETEDHCQDSQDPTLGVIPVDPNTEEECLNRNGGGIIGVAGEGEEIDPRTLRRGVDLGQKESDSLGFVFAEQKGQPLGVDVNPDICPGGPPNPCDPNDAPPQGKIVNSYLLHFDPDGAQPQSSINVAGVITFGKGEMVIGVITDAADLDATDATLGLSSPGTSAPAYPAPGSLPSRGLEILSGTPNEDFIDISADGKVVRYNFTGSISVDQVRIITMVDCSC